MLSLFLTITLSAAALAHNDIPHLDLEMTGQEYESVLSTQFGAEQKHGALDPVLNTGKRNLDWLRFINEGRETKISFSSAATQRGVPMDAPNNYNEEIVLSRYRALVASLPPEMKSVLVDGASFTKDPPLPVADYIKWGLDVDRAYQSAARWLTMKQYLWQLASRRSQDIRGYYFLTQDEAREENFLHFDEMATEKQARYKEWLGQMCLNNSGSASSCKNQVDKAAIDKTLSALFSRWKSRSESLWNGFFTIQGKYSGARWNEASKMVVPFVRPSTPERISFIKDNIEDEWRWQDWHLSVEFGSGGVDVIWEPGITPHVPGLGAGQIYMDANQPLSEYDGQWTIRHEFGHVLGFTDCYVEFYNNDTGVITNYQLDITNLMCSRRGHLQDKHVSELRRAYFR